MPPPSKRSMTWELVIPKKQRTGDFGDRSRLSLNKPRLGSDAMTSTFSLDSSTRRPAEPARRCPRGPLSRRLTRVHTYRNHTAGGYSLPDVGVFQTPTELLISSLEEMSLLILFGRPIDSRAPEPTSAPNKRSRRRAPPSLPEGFPQIRRLRIGRSTEYIIRVTLIRYLFHSG